MRSIVSPQHIIVTIITLSIMIIAGCASEPQITHHQGSLKSVVDAIQVGTTDAATVLEWLGPDGTLHSTSSVSTYRKKDFGSEVLCFVVFDAQQSIVSDSILFVHQSNQPMILVREETLELTITMTVPESVLSDSYENQTRKNIAIVDYAHTLIISAAEPFIEDRRTESLVGLCRTLLSSGVYQAKREPRLAQGMPGVDGFRYDHPTLDTSWLWLRQLDEDVYRVIIHSGGMVDPIVTW